MVYRCPMCILHIVHTFVYACHQQAHVSLAHEMDKIIHAAADSYTVNNIQMIYYVEV